MLFTFVSFCSLAQAGTEGSSCGTLKQLGKTGQNLLVTSEIHSLFL